MSRLITLLAPELFTRSGESTRKRSTMQFRRLGPVTRAPRIALRGSLSVSIQLENRKQFTAKLHRLSVTGGLLEIWSYIDERSKVTMTIQFGSAHLQARAEMFFPMRGGLGFLQPFRFVEFAPGARQRLEIEIATLLKQPPGSVPNLGVRAPHSFLDTF
jgi:hypothetical protein